MQQTNDLITEFDDEMLPEYNFNQLGQPVQGKHTQVMTQGYTITVYHDDGTTMTRQVLPQTGLELKLPFPLRAITG